MKPSLFGSKKWNSVIADIVLFSVGYVAFVIILTVHMRVTTWIFMPTAGFWDMWQNNIISPSIMYFIIMAAPAMKQHFKKKEAAEYALDVQTANIKLEMLEAFLADGVLSQKEFEKKKEELLKF